MKYHPDVNTSGTYVHEPDAEKFKKIAEAYAVLSHAESRNNYDLLSKPMPERVYKSVQD